MSDIILRKCGGCADVIEINRNNIAEVLYHKNKYYHLKCFCEVAEKRAKAKRNTAAEWQTALDNLWQLESDTKKMLETAWIKDDINEWLLNHYNITTVPSRLWQVLADLERGEYKGKKCKSITMETLLGAWQWGQKKLDSIARNNKMNHKGPTSDDVRLMYDLSILVQKIPTFLAYKNKQKIEEIERQNNIKENIKVDYSKIKSATNNGSGLDDISDLLEDLI